VSAQNDTAFLRMFMMILGALVAFTFIILIAANWVIGSVEEQRGEDPRRHAEVVKRIAPVGSVSVVQTDAAPAAPKSGAEIVAAACNACHATGVLESPKIGDKATWEQRLAAAGGLDGLTASAIKGKGGMPPKGGAMVSDAEIRAAIEDMLSNSGVDAGAAAAPAAATGPVEAAQEMAGDAADAAKSMVAAVMPTAAPEPAPPAPVAAPEPAAAPAGQALAQAKGCMACHHVAVRVVGPAYKEVAAKYKGQADAAAMLAAKVKAGGVGTWGPIPMPPQPTLTDEEVNALVAWVLVQ
jgi:cytochrome c551/c552/Na+-transporting methylmalonyl-CoA/oxaloacetate decarboxylase gamma subunit